MSYVKNYSTSFTVFFSNLPFFFFTYTSLSPMPDIVESQKLKQNRLLEYLNQKSVFTRLYY